ncbi:glycosyltransferase family 2 protein [Terrisporobacter petrolearius]|uniref:glycosyltransferase family 2 protein n=1 Tax=Terrisporobacter petrolearius TaxID=1460447 RepID=UPI003B0022C4
MKISVIMPVYNKIRYIEKSVNSILNQTYKNFELIIVDDGSSDGSESICDKFAFQDSRVRVFHIENSGVSNARNIGIENAIGEYFQFIDSDDYVDSNMLNDLLQIIIDYNPDIIISGVKKIDDICHEIMEILPPLSALKNKQDLMENFAEVQRNTGIYGCVSNKMIKKSIVDDNNLRFDTNIWLAEDLDFYLELYNYVSKIYFYQKSYYYYLQEAENSSTTSDRKNNYLLQAKIILKEKNMLRINNLLNDGNLKNVNEIITNFIMSYIYDNFNFNSSEYNKFLDDIISDKELMGSIVNDERNKFEKLIISLLSKKYKTLIYILFANRNMLRAIYRKIKDRGDTNCKITY